jgi:hypothetical protein
MLYRGLSVEEARTRFSAIVPTIAAPIVEVRRRRVIKTEPLAPTK